MDRPEDNGEKVLIGHIHLQSEITTSVFGDERLFFTHPRIGRDRHRQEFDLPNKYFPQKWYNLQTRKKDTEGWPNWAPDTWPNNEAEAKQKFIDQEQRFGCPFAWLLGIHTEEDLVNYENGTL